MVDRADLLPAWAAPPPDAQAALLASAEGVETQRVPFGEKTALLIGRNGQVCDVIVEHKSSSRVHACVAHDSTGKAWLVDLGSVHGVHRGAACSELQQRPLRRCGTAHLAGER
ncbi:hypothetical protein WJX81_006790 [Elliptochloris bilobata]|uniref:FHA domain-containing protein n=1 Tax=Elliptochloris bilobata TaxID=381761 RepID=A0AAW1QK16_9CHLO